MNSRHTISALALTLVLGVACVAQAQDTAAPPPAPAPGQGFSRLFINTSDSQREALSRFIANRYPNLVADVLEYLSKAQPDFLNSVEPLLEDIVGSQYADLGKFAQEQLLAAPQVRKTLDEIVQQRYPRLIADLRALPAGPDRSVAAGHLISEKYPSLLTDLITTIRQRFPDLLTDVQRKVMVKYPQLLVDVTALMLRRYPGLTIKLLAFLNSHYPSIVPQIARILMGPPAQPEAPQTGAVEPSSAPSQPAPGSDEPAPPQE